VGRGYISKNSKEQGLDHDIGGFGDESAVADVSSNG